MCAAVSPPASWHGHRSSWFYTVPEHRFTSPPGSTVSGSRRGGGVLKDQHISHRDSRRDRTWKHLCLSFLTWTNSYLGHVSVPFSTLRMLTREKFFVFWDISTLFLWHYHCSLLQVGRDGDGETHQICPPRLGPARRCSLCLWAGRTDRTGSSPSLRTGSAVSQARCREERGGRFCPLLSPPAESQVGRLVFTKWWQLDRSSACQRSHSERFHFEVDEFYSIKVHLVVHVIHSSHVGSNLKTHTHTQESSQHLRPRVSICVGKRSQEKSWNWLLILNVFILSWSQSGNMCSWITCGDLRRSRWTQHHRTGCQVPSTLILTPRPKTGSVETQDGVALRGHTSAPLTVHSDTAQRHHEESGAATWLREDNQRGQQTKTRSSVAVRGWRSECSHKQLKWLKKKKPLYWF